MYSKPLENYIGCESFGGIRCDLGPLLEGQIRASQHKSGPISLLLVLEVSNVQLTLRKSCDSNVLVVSDLTLNHFFKVKLW